jgi:hypothetical protein
MAESCANSAAVSITAQRSFKFVCSFFAPVYLGTDSLMSMNAYEQIIWMGCFLSYIWNGEYRNDPRMLMYGGVFRARLMTNTRSWCFFGVSVFVAGLLLDKGRKGVYECNILRLGVRACGFSCWVLPNYKFGQSNKTTGDAWTVLKTFPGVGNKFTRSGRTVEF